MQIGVYYIIHVLFYFLFFCLQSIMENVPSSSGHVGKYFLTKEFIPCKDLRLCRSHVHISQDPIQGVNQIAATFLQRVIGRFTRGGQCVKNLRI